MKIKSFQFPKYPPNPRKDIYVTKTSDNYKVWEVILAGGKLPESCEYIYADDLHELIEDNLEREFDFNENLCIQLIIAVMNKTVADRTVIRTIANDYFHLMTIKPKRAEAILRHLNLF